MAEAVPTSAPQFQMISIAQLAESPLNPRKEFDEARLGELIESVRAKGVLEFLVVRPLGKGFEVAAGARRFRAAKAAGLKQVPAMVRDLSDAEVLEVAILENVVRADISALEEGQAYRQLVREHGYTAEQIVEKTGKSRTVVFSRMKLAELQGEPRRRLAEGKLSASVAELIARLPTEKAQEAALKRLEEKKHWRLERLGEMPFRDAKEILDDEFRLRLKEAPFNVKAAELVVGVGACGDCPKRTGADKLAFPDVKLDTCLDGECWAKKAAAATRLLKAEVKKQGKELVKIGRLTEQYNPERLAAPVAEKYSRPGEKIDGKHTWKELLGSEVPVVVALDGDNKTHNLVDDWSRLSEPISYTLTTAIEILPVSEEATPSLTRSRWPA